MSFECLGEFIFDKSHLDTLFFLFAPAVTDPPGKVDDPHLEHVISHETIKCALTDHEGILISSQIWMIRSHRILIVMQSKKILKVAATDSGDRGCV